MPGSILTRLAGEMHVTLEVDDATARRNARGPMRCQSGRLGRGSPRRLRQAHDAGRRLFVGEMDCRPMRSMPSTPNSRDPRRQEIAGRMTSGSSAGGSRSTTRHALAPRSGRGGAAAGPGDHRAAPAPRAGSRRTRARAVAARRASRAGRGEHVRMGIGDRRGHADGGHRRDPACVDQARDAARSTALA